LTFYLTAATPQIGFTAGSRTFFSSTNLPELEIEAYLDPHPRIEEIQLLSTNLSVNFGTASNWIYVLQSTDGLTVAESNWSNRLFVAAQPTNSHVVFVDGVSNAARFYRLSLFR